MTTCRKMGINFILLFVSFFLFTNCVSDDYNLSKGINTDISIGGDSLSFPLGSTQKIYLDSLLKGQNLDILTKIDSIYSIHLKDSMQLKINSISPVSFSIVPIVIPPISTSFTDVKIPDFQFNTIDIESLLPIPQVTVDPNMVKPINESYSHEFSITTLPTQIKKYTTSQFKTKTDTYVVGPYEYTIATTINQPLLFNIPSDVKKVDKVMLKNSVVTLTFDKTKTNQLGFSSQSDTIKEFRIDFPAEYKLTTPIGGNSRIEQSNEYSTFIMDNVALTPGVDVFTATFIIESIDMSQIDQSLGVLSFSKDIKFSIDYKFIGESNDVTLLNSGKKIEYTVGFQNTPIVDDMELETNSYIPQVTGQEIAIDKEITNIPDEISTLNSVSFQDGASLELSIADPGILPLTFSAGSCEINLPKSFILKPFIGLDTTTNILTIPYNELFQTKSIGISGVNINQTLPDGATSISFHDMLKYTMTGLTLAPASITLKALQAMNGKIMKMNASSVGLSIKDASFITKKISINLANQTSNININQFVSTDVKRIYSAQLKTPAQLIFKINVEKLPTSIDMVYFENYTIKFPASLKFKTGDVNSQNELVLNEGFNVKDGGFTKTLTLEGFDFGTDGNILDNGTFNFNDVVTTSGKVYIEGTNLKSSQFGTVDVKPSIQIDDISLSLIEAQIDPKIDPIAQTVTLNLPDFLSNATLDLQNPVITLEVGNSTGIPINALINIIPKKKDGSVIPNATATCDLNIASATVLGQTTWSKFLIDKSEINLPGEYQHIMIPALSNLLKIAPDQIELNVAPSVAGTKQLIDLYSPKNQLDVKYSFNVPLDFGKDFSLQFNDTLKNLKTQLEQIIKYSNQIDLIAKVENKIPMNLNFEILPLDNSNQLIQGITVSSKDTLRSCDSNGNPQTSILNLSIKETVPGSLAQMNAIIFGISASKISTIAGIPLRSDQYIKLELRVRIPKGITINQGSSK